MLEKQGFAYHDRCDPFDGGPYLEAAVDKVPLVAATCQATLVAGGEHLDRIGFVSCAAHRGLGFRATRAAYALDGKRVHLAPAVADAIGASVGDAVGVTALEPGA
jgi:arginine/ornithine N-succinyltransferase beta subunit